MRLFRIVAAVLVSIAVPAIAQQKLVESIEVRVVNVDVVVTDRSGQPITGLTRDDFQIFENGKPQAITNFYEVRPERGATDLAVTKTETAPQTPPPPEEMRVRRFVLFVDNYSLDPFKRNVVLKSLEKFVDTRLRPEDEVELVLWTRSLSVVTPFTTDHKKVKAGLATLSERSRSGMSVQNEIDIVKRQCQDYLDAAKTQKISYQEAYKQSVATVNVHADQVWAMSRLLMEALRLTTTTLAGVEGRKVLVLAGAHFPQNPGMELYSYVDSLYSPYIKNLGFTLSESFSRSQTISIEKVAKQANADGVTIYTIDAADSRDVRSAEETEPTSASEEFLAFTNTAAAYERLAGITGGMSLAGTQNFDVAFETVARDLGAYYSLGYKPAGESQNDRKLVVKTKNRDYRVRSRETWTPKSQEQTISDRVVANLYHSTVKSEWPVEVRTGRPQQSGDRFAVPVELTLAPNVTLLPQGEELVGGFNVYIAVGTETGSMSKVMKSVQPVKVPKDAEARLRAKPFSFTVTIVVRPGESTLSIAAVDQISNAAGFARTTILAR